MGAAALPSAIAALAPSAAAPALGTMGASLAGAEAFGLGTGLAAAAPLASSAIPSMGLLGAEAAAVGSPMEQALMSQVMDSSVALGDIGKGLGPLSNAGSAMESAGGGLLGGNLGENLSLGASAYDTLKGDQRPMTPPSFSVRQSSPYQATRRGQTDMSSILAPLYGRR